MIITVEARRESKNEYFFRPFRRAGLVYLKAETTSELHKSSSTHAGISSFKLDFYQLNSLLLLLDLPHLGYSILDF